MSAVPVARWAWARRAPLAVGGVLLLVYVATMAPDLTFWDAGEFVAAAHSLGIPHPPGTPLFILLLSVWAKLLPFLSFPAATNLFSGFVTAIAAALTVRLVMNSARDAWLGAAAGLCAGGMSSVWLNATETEVYAASLALAILTVVAAERAGRLQSARWHLFVAYLMALSVPLHLSALLAAPAAISLAASAPDERIEWSTAAGLLGVLAMVVGIGTSRLWVGIAGGILLVLSPLVRRACVRPGAWLRADATRVLGLLVVTLLGVSAAAFLLVRAAHDPAINQGNPTDFRTLLYVLARKQYAVPGLWPREAPWWLQVGNLFEYVDWQVALSLAPGVTPSIGRVAFTLAFVALAMHGATVHHRLDRRTWRAVALLTLVGSLGAVAYLNLKASPSFGYGILPPNAVREARERDYFFVLGFWGWGMWAGMGAVSVVRQRRLASWGGLAVAAIPIVLNWRAVERRSAPESEIPRRFGEELLAATPPNAVLFTGGDNDTYLLWALQEVDGRRPDVTVVTLPLLAAEWNQREVARRTSLLEGGAAFQRRATFDAALDVARQAHARGRPVVTSVLASPSERARIGSGWVSRGMVYVAERPGEREASRPGVAEEQQQPTPRVDVAEARRAAERIEQWRRGRDARLFVDPVNRYMLELLACPSLMVVDSPTNEQIRSLDSTCNRR